MDSISLEIISLIVSVAALITAAAAIYFSKKATFWRKIFSSEEQPDNLEEVIQSITQKIKHLNTEQKNMGESIVQISDILQTAVQYVAIERFDSTADDGGNLSFSLAMLDRDHNGFIVTSMHGRQHNRIYCKQVVAGEPQQTLSQEEQSALIDAINSHKQKIETKS